MVIKINYAAYEAYALWFRSPWITGSILTVYKINWNFPRILGIGTVCSNRISGCVFTNDNNIKLKGRGTFDSKVVTKWNDNKFVHVISNYQELLPINQVKRECATVKKK